MCLHEMFVTFSILTISLNLVQSSPRIIPLVQTNLGLIRGLKATDGDYSMFLGIPYGRVQEDNHFGTSIPFPPFEDVFFAQNDTSICPQMERQTKNPLGNIDCLHLNVYVPDNASSANKVPVMVFIYGGGFKSGDKRMSNFGPRFLMKHDVILVTINYRLGVYGFMCLDDPRAPGNQGLKDQLLALRWVKNNIEAFGGDANKITISGQSAGAASVDIHTLTNNEALFDKAILESRPILWVNREPDKNAPFKLAEALDFNGGNIAEALSYLSKLSSDKVIAKAEEMAISFLPCVENKYEDVEILIETDPINLKAEKAKNIPVLIGTNDDEITYSVDMKVVGDLFRKRLEDDFHFDEEKLNAVADILRKFYIGDADITEEVSAGLSDMDSDFDFHHSTQRQIKNYLEGGRTIFYYMFSYVGTGIQFRGASHGEELSYLFDRLVSEPDLADQLMIDRLTTLWTNFMKYGDPTPETSTLLPVKWTPVSEGRMNYLSLDRQIEMKSRPFKERMAFWDLFYDTYAKMQKGYEENDLYKLNRNHASTCTLSVPIAYVIPLCISLILMPKCI